MNLEIRSVKYPGYFVSRCGQVLSIKTGFLVKMKTLISTNGYEKISLSSGKKGIYHYPHVHSLVLEAFGSKRVGKMTCNHKNGNKLDNRIENLEWMTQTENERHSRLQLGKDCRGQKHKCSKISENDVLDMRRLRKEGHTYDYLSKKFDIGISQVSRIVRLEKWGHVR